MYLYTQISKLATYTHGTMQYVLYQIEYGKFEIACVQLDLLLLLVMLMLLWFLPFALLHHLFTTHNSHKHNYYILLYFMIHNAYKLIIPHLQSNVAHSLCLCNDHWLLRQPHPSLSKDDVLVPILCVLIVCCFVFRKFHLNFQKCGMTSYWLTFIICIFIMAHSNKWRVSIVYMMVSSNLTYCVNISSLIINTQLSYFYFIVALLL